MSMSVRMMEFGALNSRDAYLYMIMIDDLVT
jgi:hypothetical protein